MSRKTDKLSSDVITDAARYVLLDLETNQQIPVDIFLDRVKGNYWERAYAKVLADYIGVAGTATNNVLAWLIRNKDSNNRIIGTIAHIAKELDAKKAIKEAMELVVSL